MKLESKSDPQISKSVPNSTSRLRLWIDIKLTCGTDDFNPKSSILKLWSILKIYFVRIVV